MKKAIIIFLTLLLSIALTTTAFSAIKVHDGYNWTRLKDENIILNVYNWGEYISNGADESIDVIKEFELLTGIKVNYSTYDTNESLYSKMKSGAADYDVIIPSDYMIGKMRKEDMLAKLDYANIPNIDFIGHQYKGRSYDPNNEFCVPYTWGIVGIIYNTTMVDEEVTSWSSLWDEKYADNILMFNNSRDAFAIAAKKIGKSINPSSQEDLNLVFEELKTQKKYVQANLGDEIFDKMEGGEAALAPFYAGDAITMISENPDLAFCVPTEGTNFFVDAMCIPKASNNKEAGEMFINFMCETDIAVANCKATGYATPQLKVKELLPDELKNNPIAYPSDEVLANTETFEVLPDIINDAMDKAWSDLKSFDENGSGWIIPIILVCMVALIVVVFWYRASKAKRNDY